MSLLQRSPSASCSFSAAPAPTRFRTSARAARQQADIRHRAAPKAFALHTALAPGRPAPAAPDARRAPGPLAPLTPARVHNGNPKQGTLLVLAQMHRTTDPNNPLAKSPGIARSQGIILEALLKAKPEVVFFEGHHAPMEPGSIEPSIKQAFQDAFARWPGMRQALTPQQAELLRRFGADVAYACLAKHPVHLPITEDRKVMEDMLKRVQGGAVLEEEAAKIHAQRDRHFAQVLKDHFTKHPGSTAFFVVGAVHDLVRQCDARAGFDPQLLWYNTTEFSDAMLAEQQKMVYSFAQ